ncbi:MAG: hypothetical protein OHK0029_41020 [Armatimonadaceae bacterium]
MPVLIEYGQFPSTEREKEITRENNTEQASVRQGKIVNFIDTFSKSQETCPSR